MLSLLLASAFFLLIHFGVAGTRLRDALVARLGEGPYRGAFSLASFVGIFWMGYAYARAPLVETWGKLPGLRPVAFVVIFLAALFVVVGLATPSPTSAGLEDRLGQGAAATLLLCLAWCAQAQAAPVQRAGYITMSDGVKLRLPWSCRPPPVGSRWR